MLVGSGQKVPVVSLPAASLNTNEEVDRGEKE